MKKYLITSAAALALCGLITSCSHDIDGLTPEESVAATYEKAFITAFGQPAPDQTWGFGPSVSTSRAMTRATAEEWPTYAKSMSDYLQFTIAEMQGWTALTNDVLTSYPNGNHTLNDLQYTNEVGKYYGDGDGHHYRIPSGTTVTEYWNVGEGSDNNGATLDNVVVYVEGKVIITSSNTLNAVTLVVGNGGEIEFRGENRMSTTGRFVVAGGGKITGTEGALLGIENAAPCYNAGTIEFDGTLRVNGSNFYNCGTVNVDVLTGTTTYTTVTNFGKITARTNAIQGESYNGYYINACHLTFTENAGIGQLILLNSSRLDVGGQLYISGENYMYNMSEINANSIYWQTVKLHGPSNEGEFAVVKSSKFLVSHADEIWTYGNIYYDINPEEFYNYQNQKYTPTDIANQIAWDAAHHIKGGTDGSSCWCDYPIRLWSTEANATISIPAGECTGAGYNTNEEPDENTVRVIAEDLTASTGNDFDFNDVVFDVKIDPTNHDYVLIVLRAAGGTLPLYIGEGDKYEVHKLFEQETNIMINTGAKAKGYANSEDGLPPVGFSIPNPLKGTDRADDVKQVAKEIRVTVIKNVNGTSTPCVLQAEPAKATAKLCVGTDFKYTEGDKTYPCLTEQTDIQGKFIYESELNSEYRHKPKFPLYVQGIFEDDWYKPTAEPLPKSNN